MKAKPKPKPRPVLTANGRKIGYTRVSTGDQTDLMQVQDLKAFGCVEIVREVGSGGNRERPELLRLLRRVRAGDTLVVWKLDRLGRSLPHLIEVVQSLADQGVNFASLRDAIDTGSAGGRLYFHVLGALAEFERDLVRERVAAGLAAARVEGRIGGRPLALTPERAAQAQALLDEGRPPTAVAREIGVGRSTIYMALRHGELHRS